MGRYKRSPSENPTAEQSITAILSDYPKAPAHTFRISSLKGEIDECFYTFRLVLSGCGVEERTVYHAPPKS